MTTTVVFPVAGRGTRMKELAAHRPKSLIPVAGQPFLYYLLKNAVAAGFDDIVLVIGHHAPQMEAFAAEHSELPLRLINQFERVGTENYGTAVPMWAIEGEVNNDFAWIYGDGLYTVDDLKLLCTLPDDVNYIGIAWTETPERLGVPTFDEDGFVKDYVEKSQTFISNWASCGCFKFSPEIIPLSRTVPLSPRGEYELNPAVKALAERRLVRAHRIVGPYFDFGHPEDVSTVEEFLKNRM